MVTVKLPELPPPPAVTVAEAVNAYPALLLTPLVTLEKRINPNEPPEMVTDAPALLSGMRLLVAMFVAPMTTSVLPDTTVLVNEKSPVKVKSGLPSGPMRNVRWPEKA